MILTNQDISDMTEYLKDQAEALGDHNTYPNEEIVLQKLLCVIMILRNGDVI